MKKNLLLTLILTIVTAGIFAQSTVLNPNDSVINYNAAKPPTIPAANTIAKWVRTTTRITWNTNKFKSYYYNGMAFRLRYPNGYNAADTTMKYPVILFLHGAGEIAKIYDNEDQLVWGAQPFQAKIDAGQFNAFLLFPQVSAIAWDYTYYTRINDVLDTLTKNCHADPDRLITMGLSNGGFGALAYATGFPQRASTVIASSPALIQLMQEGIDNVINIPFWISSGGLDASPAPEAVNTYVNSFRAKGGNIKYSFYPNNGHDTWQAQWNESFLIPYWASSHKANPLILNNVSQFCENAVNAKLSLTPGFAEYQWQLDNVDLPNSNSNEIVGTKLGTYRARFRRVQDGKWSDWSVTPAVITALPATTSPAITVVGTRSVVLPATDSSTTVPLQLPVGYAIYEWRRATDSVVVSTSRTYAAPVGSYIAKAANCNATFSPVFNVVNANGSNRPDSARNLTLNRVSPTSIKLVWEKAAMPVSNETGFEIYRGEKAGGPYKLAKITAANVKTYTDTSIANNYNFYYVIRAVNATGASGLSNEASLQPAADSVAPTTPANLKAIFTSRNYIDLEWTASADSVGVTAYDVYVNGVKKYTTTTAKISADSLVSNTAYTFTVKARDQAGNVSDVSNAITSTSKLNGLKYHYYEGTWDMLPNFTALTAVASGLTPSVDITARPAGVINNYGFVWEGLINIKVPGAYTFETISDDGSKLYYNSFYSSTATPLVSNDGIHGGISATGTVNIADTGLHPIAITFFQQSSGQSMQVYWTGPGIARQLIPASAFTESFVAVVDTIAPTAPANFKSAFTSRNYVDLVWDNSTDSVGVVAYDVYVNNVKKYTTSGTMITADSLLPDIAYTFAIKARDFAGNNSNASTATITTTATALKYKYYQGSWDMLPDFSTLTPVKTGSTKNVDVTVRPAGVIGDYGFLWEGYINIKTPGAYTFETISDDGSKLYFDTVYTANATPIISNDGIHGAITKTATVNVTDTGMHPIAITYFQKTSGQSMNVYWTGPGIARQLIPDSAFTQAYKLLKDVIAPSAPTALKSVFLSNTSIDLSWTASTDNIGVVAYDIYIAGVKKYTSITNNVTADSLTANTTYAFTVRARDLAGNSSSASSTVSAKTSSSAAGLKYQYYQGAWDVLPDFNILTPVKSGTSANVDLTVAPTAVVDNYGFLWQGYINIPAAGTYTFETISDDGSKLYFNSQYLATATATVNNDGLHGATSATGTVTVAAAGYYPISITFFERDGGQSMAVYWSSASITRQAIPSSAFVYQLPADNVVPSTPTNVRAALVNSTFINLTWNSSTDNVGVTGYDVYVNGTKKYTTSTPGVTADSLTAGTSYVFTVKARDFAGNTSAFSTALTTATSATTSGLTYKYYEGTWDMLPDFSKLSPVKTGFTPNVDILTARNRTDNYGFVWEGNISLPTAGTYTFETISDDGSKVYFNSTYLPNANAVVNNDGVHGPISATGSVTVAAGSYPIAITFFENNSGESMQIYWTGPGIARQLIPNSAFTGTFVLPGDAVAPSVPSNIKAILTTNSFVDIAWDASTDNIAVTGYDVYVNGVKKTTVASTNYRLTGLTAGESNTFTIKALDLANNMSAFSTAVAVIAAPKVNGFKYRYYEGAWSKMPNFDTLTVKKTGSSNTTDISVKPAASIDNFGFIWEGYINITTPGNYTFETISDDGSKFYFNTLYNPAATALVDNDGLHAATSVTGTVNIPVAGLYPITATFFERDGGETMQLYYSGPGIARQLITIIPSGSVAGGTATETTISLKTLSAADNESPIVASITNAYPNPFTDNIKIQFTSITSANNVSVGVYDLNGKLMQRKLFGSTSAGANILTLNLDNQMMPGMYLVRLDIEGKQVKMWKMIKQKR